MWYAKRTALVAVVFFAGALVLQMRHLDFGLPGRYIHNGQPVAVWFPDDDWMTDITKNFIVPRWKVFTLSHPPLQNLLVAAAHAKTRVIGGRVPDDGALSLTARQISAFSVAITAALLFGLGRWLGYRASFLAALFFSVAPLTSWVGHDFKAEALAGAFLVSAIAVAHYLADNPASGAGFGLMGGLLGLAGMCSYWTVYFLHLPFLVYILHTRPHLARRGATDPTVPASGSSRIVSASLATLAVLFLAGAGWLRFRRDDVLGLARAAYDRQAFARPFDYHRGTIITYVGQLEIALLLGAALVLVALVYVSARRALRNSKRFPGLRFPETSYGWTLLVFTAVMGVATLLDPLVPVSLLEFVRILRLFAGKSGYYGLNPGPMTAPGYFGTVLAYCVGWPLLLLGLAGVVYLALLRNPHHRLVVFTFLPVGVIIGIGSQTNNASRFAYLFCFVVYLAAGLLADRLLRVKPRLVGLAVGTAAGAVALYTLAFAVSYVEGLQYRGDGRVRAAEWLAANVEPGAPVGLMSHVGLPRNLGPAEIVAAGLPASCTDYPTYCVLGGFEFHVMQQYFRLSQKGYVYSPRDWAPSWNVPTPGDLAVYADLIHERRYKLVEHAKPDTPSVAGLEFSHRYLDDPAAFFHREVYVFRRRD
jgi:hypothetical protein